MRYGWLAAFLLGGALAGCGTTNWTDTRRSATEQLLITDAMDRAVSHIDFRVLAGKSVYLDSAPLKGVTDEAYLVSALRQHLLASRCILKDAKNDADYVVEVRAGAVGTDRHDVSFGVPGVDIPAGLPTPGVGIPTSIPEMTLVKRTNQRAVTKLSVFAYNRETGRRVWQSGAIPVESSAKALWVFGAGPFQRGTIYEGTEFAGNRLKIPLADLRGDDDDPVSVADEAYFRESDGTELATNADPPDSPPEAETAEKPPAAKVVAAGHANETPPAKPPANSKPRDTSSEGASPSQDGQQSKSSPADPTQPMPGPEATTEAPAPPAEATPLTQPAPFPPPADPPSLLRGI